jgi:hypothetical protein
LSLLEQSPVWLVPFVVLMLVMVHAMMEFTLSLLVRRPRHQRKPASADTLRRRLLALNAPGRPYPLVEGEDCDFEIVWGTDARAVGGGSIIGRWSTSSRVRLVLDEQRHELRINQVSRSFEMFVGLQRWVPVVRIGLSAQAGPAAQSITREIEEVAQRSGWSVRPVVLWFQATRRGLDVLRLLTPAPLRAWPARRTWGVVYALSFLLGVGYLAVLVGPLESQDALILIGVAASWWGIWGCLAWMLLGFPQFWRRRRR